MSEILEKIRSQGYWRTRIHPTDFVEKRVPSTSDLRSILERTSVGFRGWNFPHLGAGDLEEDTDWMGRETDWEYYVEFWRYYQSGQFIFFSGMKEDWQRQCSLSSLYKGIKPRAHLDVPETILRFTEFFEFAARLTLAPANYSGVHLEIEVDDLKGRTLWDRPGGLYVPDEHVGRSESFKYKSDLSSIQLITRPKELAVETARDLFCQFGWSPGVKWLREIQSELLIKGKNFGR